MISSEADRLKIIVAPARASSPDGGLETHRSSQISAETASSGRSLQRKTSFALIQKFCSPQATCSSMSSGAAVK